MRIDFPISKTIFSQCSTTALGASSTFKPAWFDMTGYHSVIAVAKSNVDGTLYMEFIHTAEGVIPSSDDTADSSLPFDTEGGIAEPPHQLTLGRRWFRPRYVNGSTEQTSFQLVVTAGNFSHVVAPANIALAQNADAAVVRSIDQVTDISQGKLRGNVSFRKYGENNDVDAANYDISWGMAGAYTGLPSASPENIEVVSTSDQDTLTTGSGAWTLKFFYLDDNWNLAERDVNLNGTTPVDSGVSGMRVYRAYITTSASSSTVFNTGTITIRWATTESVVFLNIPPGQGQSRHAGISVPAGYKGYLQSFNIEMQKTASANGSVGIYRKDFGASPRIQYPHSITQSSPVSQEFRNGWEEFDEKSDMVLRVLSISTTNVNFVGNFDFRIIKQ